MKRAAAVASRPATMAAIPLHARPPPPAAWRCYYATHSAPANPTEPARRRPVTPFNDDGQVPWSALSANEKTGRAAQQTVNGAMVLLGLVLTGGVGYFLYQDVLSPDSKVAYYNRAVDRIRKDPRCLAFLGEGDQITAFGVETNNRWQRSRPIASTLSRDGSGIEHLRIQFNVRGPKGSGVVSMHLIKRPGASEWEYRHFFVDVPGQERIYLENARAASNQRDGKLFGIRWT